VTPVVESLDSILEKSAATPEFKAAVRDLTKGARSGERVAFNPVSPPVKVLRAISKLLSHYSEIEVDRVIVEGFSGCSDYVGKIEVLEIQSDQKHVFEFVWDCKWRAQQEGWTDDFGLPDQMRAARMFGWDCFKKWEKLT
jgi:molybdopterin-guanine dinucleotide biosynthesis protein